MELKTLNYDMLKAAGRRGLTDFLIALRSREKLLHGKIYRAVHSELRYSGAFHHLSFSATMRDLCCCCRFKQIGYSSPYWDTDFIPADEKQEERLWKAALRMAGFGPDTTADQVLDICRASPISCAYTNNAIPYDLLGCALSHITAAKLWRPDPVGVWCCEAVCDVLQTEWPDFNGPSDETTPALLRVEALKKWAAS